jgi:nitroreductase
MSAALEPTSEVLDLPIHEQFRRRRSPRAFSSDPVEPEKLHRVLEAARWAPSASNEQPWRFVVARRDQPDEFARFLGFIKEGNVVWAQHAPVLLLSVARTRRERDGGQNRHAFHDVGQAVANLTLQALEEGLYVHQMGGFEVEKARETLHIPDDYDPVAVIALGYPGDPADLPEALQERERAARTRKPLSELVFEGDWEKPLAR